MIRLGSDGWSHKDWEGVVCPTRDAHRGSRATCLAHYFDTIEINSTFYRSLVESWLAKELGGAGHWELPLPVYSKLWRGFTHERNATADDERQFKEGIDPLAGWLGVLLLQFPWSCEYDEGNCVSVRLVPPLMRLSSGPRSATSEPGSNGLSSI